MSRKRRKPRPGIAHYAAPVAFLLGVTIAVLLVHSAFDNGGKTTSTLGPTPTTTAQTTSTSTAAGAKKRFYAVRPGDTFGTIADKEGISVEQLQALNPGTSSNALQVGQKLRVK